MNILEVILISVSLSIDNMALAAAAGCGRRKHSVCDIIKTACVFSVMGALCFSLGWVGGNTLQKFIASWDHWVAFIILAYIGGKMIYASLRKDACLAVDIISFKSLALLALATNIDALAIGISMALYEIPLYKMLLILTLCIISATALGFAAGRKLGSRLGKRAELAAGAVLIILGLKILFEGLAH